MSTLRAVQSLERLIAQAVANHEAIAGRVGLNATDLRCLGLIGAEEGMTPTRLAELTGLTTGAITGVLDRLEGAGYLRRVPDPTDRRRLTMDLDPERMTELAHYYQPPLDRALELSRTFGLGDARRFSEFADGLATALSTEAERLRVATHGGLVGDVYTAPRGDVERGQLIFQSGAPRISLNAAALGQQMRMVAETAATRLRLSAASADDDELVRATFVGPPPDARASSGVVTLRYRRRLLDVRSREAAVALHPGIPWRLDVDGGVTDLDADLTGIQLERLEVDGGANHLRLVLPAPRRSVLLNLQGGSSTLEVLRPRGTALELRLRGGAARLRFDGQRLDSVGGHLRMASDDFAGAVDRYEVDVSGGAGELRIGFRQGSGDRASAD